jgi:UDP-N-acetylmuramoyl-tripeptide--D-alanyl-D-alanine ligase
VSYATLIVGLAAFGVASARWARVVQREHYISGSCARMATIWVRARVVNALLAAALLGLLGTLVLVSDKRDQQWIAGALAICSILLPFWLSIRGRSKPLQWTRRLRVLAATSGAVLLVALLVAGLRVHWSGLPAIASVLVPLAFEAGLRITAPFERRIALGFQRKAEARLRAVDPQVIAITGSWGKTSTKNHVRDLANGWVDTAISPASFNNQAGLSRTMNEHLPDGAQLLVVEMGMYGAGEIKSLCDWIKPTIGVITSIGPMHLERVGSIEGIVAAKAEILIGTTTAVLWVEHPELARLAEATSNQRVWRCGWHGTDRLDVSVEIVDDQVVVRHGDATVGAVATGRGLHPPNIACAVAASLATGVPASHLAKTLANLQAPIHRLDIARAEAGFLVIDDTFNSNPEGARAALSALATAVSGRRVVVTPGMFELGPLQFEANTEWAREIVGAGAELVITGFSNRRALRRGAADASAAAIWRRNRTSALQYLRPRLSSEDGVLWENDLPDHYP